MEGTTHPEHSVLVGSLDSGLREEVLSLEPLEQSVLDTLLVVLGRNYGNRPAGALGSGIAIGLWIIVFGIADAADVEYRSG